MSEKDIISKALIEQLASCLVTQLLKLSVVPDSIEWLRRFPNSLIPPELVFLPLFCVVETRT